MRDLLTVETTLKRLKWSDEWQASVTRSLCEAGWVNPVPKVSKMVEGGAWSDKQKPSSRIPVFVWTQGGALAKPIWRYQDPLKWNCKGQSLSLTCWLHYVQLCTFKDSRLHHDADIEVELKGSDLTQIHAEPQVSSKTWVQTFFKHFSSMKLFLSGKEGNYSQRKQWSRW